MMGGRAASLALLALAGGAMVPAQLEDAPSPNERFGPIPASEQIPVINVNVYEYGFEPSRVVIKTGQVIVWRNIGTELHNVTPRTRAGERVWKAAARRGTTRHLFESVGTYPYFCRIHTQMRGRVVVRRTV